MGAAEWTNDDYIQSQKSFRLRILNFIISKHNNSVILSCSSQSKSNESNPTQQANISVNLQGVWARNTFYEGAIIHLVNPLKHKKDECYVIDNQNGLVVIEPDNLYNCTLIASSLFCERKTWLNNVFLGQVGTNKAMLVGTLVHEIFQFGVKNRTTDRVKLISKLDELLDDATIMLEIYSVELHLKDIRDEVLNYIPSVCEWIENYMLTGPMRPLDNAPDIEVKMVRVRDIEENVWSTKYGLKGKIDVTGVVRVHDRKSKSTTEKTIPLELKTGNPNLSSSHAAQVSLYSMMIEDRYSETNQGFVIYLKNKATLVNVPLTNSIKRDLIQRRNQINHYMQSYFEGPEMLDQSRTCQNCERRTECILMSNIYEKDKLDSYPVMKSFEKDAIGHLDDRFVAFFKRYHERLVSILTKSSLDNLGLGNGDTFNGRQASDSFWTITSEVAEKSGLGFGKLKISQSSDPKVCTFVRHPKCKSNFIHSVMTKPVNSSNGTCTHKTKKIRIDDYFKPAEKKPNLTNGSENENLLTSKPFDVKANLTRCRVAISLDLENSNIDTRNSSTAIAIGFINKIEDHQLTMKLYEGSIDTTKPDLVYRIDKLVKRTNIDVERTVLVRLLELKDCDKIRQLIVDPEYKPECDLKLNLLILSDHFEMIKDLSDVAQKFVLGAAATTNFQILDERVEPERSKIDSLVSKLVRLIRELERSVLVVCLNLDHLNEFMRLLQKVKLQFILVDDGSSTKARYAYSSSLVKVPQTDNLNLSKKFDIYVRQHEQANIVITTYAMSIGGLQFTRRRFDYCIAFDCDKTELLLGLSPMFCSERYILIDVMDDRDCVVIDETGAELVDGDVTLGSHLRSLRSKQ